MIKQINPAELPPPIGAYAYATQANGFLFISGLLPMLPNGEKLASAPFKQQVTQTLSNMLVILKAAGLDQTKLVQVRVYLTNIDNWPEFNEVYSEWIGTHRAARCVIPVPSLHSGVAIEIEATAVA